MLEPLCQRISLAVIEARQQLTRCNCPIGILTERFDENPIHAAIEPDSQPATRPDIWRSEEALGSADNQVLLGSFRSSAPKVWEGMIVVTIGPEHHELLPCEEGW